MSLEDWRRTFFNLEASRRGASAVIHPRARAHQHLLQLSNDTFQPTSTSCLLHPQQHLYTSWNPYHDFSLSRRRASPQKHAHTSHSYVDSRPLSRPASSPSSVDDVSVVDWQMWISMSMEVGWVSSGLEIVQEDC